MKFKKQIVIATFVSLLLTSCSFNLKAGIIKHESKNENLEEVIKQAEETVKEAEEILNKEEKISEEEKSELVDKVKKELEELVVALSETADEIKIKELLKDKFENCTSFKITNIYFATEEGGFHLIPEQHLPDGFDPRGRGWYSSTKENGEATAAFIDVVTESEVLSVYFVVKSDEKILGVLGVDINLDNSGQ